MPPTAYTYTLPLFSSRSIEVIDPALATRFTSIQNQA